MGGPAAWWPAARTIAILLLLGLPAMAGYCAWQAQVARDRGDEPLARSYTDATRGFLGMGGAGLVLLVVGVWGYHRILAVLAGFEAGM